MFKSNRGYYTLVFFFLGLIAFSQELEFVENQEGILLMEDGQSRYFYHVLPRRDKGKFARANYVHPLYGLDGEVLTEDFPDDHPHHHGIFWAWHQLYAEGERIGDPWLNEGVEWQVVKTKTEVKEKKEAILSSEILWVNKATSEAVIRENLVISFNRMTNDVYKLKFVIELTALMDGVAIGGSEDAKAYGGFSARLKLAEDVNFHSIGGKVEPANLAIHAGPWINISGGFNSSGVVIMGEPENLPGYQGWILRSANSMQNMAFPGEIPLSIENGNTLVFRNQILIHRDLSRNEIIKYYREFKR